MEPIASARCGETFDDLHGSAGRLLLQRMTPHDSPETLLPALERELHDRSVRRDRARLDGLLDPDFVEVGRSGRVYTKTSILPHLAAEDPVRIHAQDFHVALLAEDVALVTYRAAHVLPGGEVVRHSLRCSIWLRGEHGWRLRYQQGTPADAVPGDAQAQ